jgi:putative phosphoribosyl transferase
MYVGETRSWVTNRFGCEICQGIDSGSEKNEDAELSHSHRVRSRRISVSAAPTSVKKRRSTVGFRTRVVCISDKRCAGGSRDFRVKSGRSTEDVWYLDCDSRSDKPVAQRRAATVRSHACQRSESTPKRRTLAGIPEGRKRPQGRRPRLSDHRRNFNEEIGDVPAIASRSIAIPLDGGRQIDADLQVPARAAGLVVFAHGSGSSRFSSRNRAVADSLVGRGLGTLLLDLLTREEEAVDVRTREYRFDIRRLATRMIVATDWIGGDDDLRRLSIGFFGASTGAAAALIAAAERPSSVRAVVSRGGRPDLAGDMLAKVAAPTLLIVGGRDEPVIDLNEQAMAKMRALVELKIVPGATHLFEEPGTLEEVEQVAGEWFMRYLAPEPRTDPGWKDARG